jgi:hypothetical protein
VRSEKEVAEAGDSSEERERPPLEAATKQRLLKTEKIYMCCSYSEL